MVPEIVHAKHLAMFTTIKNELDSAGLPANIIEKSEEIPLNTLLAAIKPDDKQRERFIHFSFIPLQDDDLDHIQLLQFYTTLPSRWVDKFKDQVEQILPAINSRLAIGHFSMREDGEIHFRYVHCAPTDRVIDHDQLVEIVSLYVFMLDLFSAYIDDAATGKKTAAKVLIELE